MSLTSAVEQHNRDLLAYQRSKAAIKRAYKPCAHCSQPPVVTLPSGDRVCTTCAEGYFQGMLQMASLLRRES